MFHEFSLTCHHLSPNLPVQVTFGFSRALGFGSGIFSLQAVGHDEALQAFIFDQRGDVFFEKFSRQRLNMAEKKQHKTA